MIQTPNYSTMLFKEVFDDEEDFYEQFATSKLVPVDAREEDAKATFWMLYAKHGNDPICNMDINQWKYRLWLVMYEFMPTWSKKQELQTRLRGITWDELQTGSTVIYNSAQNPQGEPTTQTLDELSYINSQNTTKYKKSKLEAYSQIQEFLTANHTQTYLNQFKKLFKIVVTHEHPTLYITDDE